nr:MAG TPA: Non-structural protein NS1 A, Effector Domain, solution [Caudoviricetes sp.]
MKNQIGVVIGRAHRASNIIDPGEMKARPEWRSKPKTKKRLHAHET